MGLTRTAKTLIYDIESFPNLSLTWGKYDQNVIAFKRERMMCSVAYKWLGEKETKCLILPDFSSYKRDKFDNKQLVKAFHKVICEADITVAHNGIKFDEKMINTDFIVRGLKPPAPHKVVDTLRMARGRFAFNSNRLDDLGERLKVGRKVKHPGIQLWIDCMDGDKKAWAHMRRYNIQDVKLLEKVYLKLRPWDKKHPNMNDYENRGCPACGGFNLAPRGYVYLAGGRRRRFKCLDCGKWSALHITHGGDRQKYKNA